MGISPYIFAKMTLQEGSEARRRARVAVACGHAVIGGDPLFQKDVVGAAEHHLVAGYGRQMLFKADLLQAENIFFDLPRKAGGRKRKERAFPFDARGEGGKTGGGERCGRGEDEHPPRARRRGAERGFQPDDGKRAILPERVRRGGRRRIAGDDRRGERKAHEAEKRPRGKLRHFPPFPATVRRAAVVTVIEKADAGQRPHTFRQHREPADAAVEERDRLFRLSPSPRAKICSPNKYFCFFP